MSKYNMYYVEFSDEKVRKYHDIPYNETVVAKSRNLAKNMVLKRLRKNFPNEKFKIEGVYSP